MSPIPPAIPTPAKKQKSKKKLFLIITGLLVACGFLMIIFIGGIIMAVMTMIKKSEPYQVAMGKVQQDEQIIQYLGEPIEPGWFITGNIKLSNDSGNANIQIPISGSHGAGTLYVEAEKEFGKWDYKRVVCHIKSKDMRIDISNAFETPKEVLPLDDL